MKRPTWIVAGGLLALALAGCGRYGPPVRAPKPAAAPAASAPADPGAAEPVEEPGEPESTSP